MRWRACPLGELSPTQWFITFFKTPVYYCGFLVVPRQPPCRQPPLKRQPVDRLTVDGEQFASDSRIRHGVCKLHTFSGRGSLLYVRGQIDIAIEFGSAIDSFSGRREKHLHIDDAGEPLARSVANASSVR